MYPTTAAFTAALTASHQIATRADILAAGAVVRSGLAVVDGHVDVDVTAAIRRKVTLTVVDVDGTLTPDIPTDQLVPYGNELKVWRGIQLTTGPELVPLGVFGISKVEVVDVGTRTIRVDGYDRSRKVARARFTDVYTIAAGTNYGTAIQTLISSRVAGLTYNFAATSSTTPQLVFNEEGDPWKAATDMATSIGMQLLFDPDGICVLRPQPDPTTAPVTWQYVEGVTATVLEVDDTFDDEPGYNGAIVYGTSTAAAVPVRAESWDTDPTSPTYYLGAYGKVPIFLRSEMITTQTQAQAAADALKLASMGGTEALRFTGIVNPAHDGDDVVQVARAAAGVNSLYVLEAFPIPLNAAGAMTATTRKRRH